MTEPPEVRDALRAMLAGRPVVLSGGPVAALARSVPEVTELTGQRPFLLAHGLGTGSLPAPEEAVVHLLPAENAASLVRAVHQQLQMLADLPADAGAALDAWDPERRAVVLASPFFTGRQIGGRTVIGGRRPEWAALEDKTIADALWDTVGVQRAPARVVATSYDALRSAARDVDHGAGTVWSGDAREGFNGGGEFVRWLRDDRQARAASEFFAAHCDRVRVMPFLDGVPCSIHGVVFPDGNAVLRPVEMVTLRRTDGAATDQFVYGGMSTHWDPAEPDRAVMRDVARRVAAGLREQVGYLGGFSVDGVLTADGFLPTELNPRFSGGLGAIAKGLPDFPLHLVLDAGRPHGPWAGSRRDRPARHHHLRRRRAARPRRRAGPRRADARAVGRRRLPAFRAGRRPGAAGPNACPDGDLRVRPGRRDVGHGHRRPRTSPRGTRAGRRCRRAPLTSRSPARRRSTPWPAASPS
jgi:hypothetical protein